MTYPPMPEGESRYGYGVPPTPAGGTRPGVGAKDANPFSALFDFSFAKFATPGLIKIVYILSVVIAGGTWLLFVLAGFSADSVVDGTGAGIIALLFGWIPALFSIAVTRFLLEGIVAVIRIHDRVTEIAARDAGETQA
ncbi:MAG: DUF4282 domain-containing protein [Propionibacteriaceae bacterium]|nr:DUF4282 domain-containing protein [Propionibacteriaceae bacterium]